MSYYKYQDVKTLEEYKLKYEESKTNEPNDSTMNRAIEIPIFRNCEFNIERLSKEIIQFENHLSKYEKYHKELKSISKILLAIQMLLT